MSPNLKTTAQTSFSNCTMTQQRLVIFRRKVEVKARTSRLAWRSFSFSARTRCCSALSARRFSCETSQPSQLRRRQRLREPLLCIWEGFTHDPVLQGDQLLLLLLPALEVSIDQGLQLDQILVLTFLLDVLQGAVQQRCHR